MKIFYNQQNVPRVFFTDRELSELETKEFRLSLMDFNRKRAVDFTITPYLEGNKRIVKTSEDSYRFNLDGDLKTLRVQRILPVEIYEGFRVYLTSQKQ